MAVVVSHGLFCHSYSRIWVGACPQKLSCLLDVVQTRGAVQLCPVEFTVFDYSVDTHEASVSETNV